jgi:hypothetical protein
LRAGKAQAYRVDAGVVRRRSLSDRFAIFTRTLKARLTTLIAAQAMFVVVMGAVGLLATQNSNVRMKSIYEDRAVPLAQLFEINDRSKEASIMLYDAAVNGRAGKPVGDVADKGPEEFRGDQQGLGGIHGDLSHPGREGRGGLVCSFAQELPRERNQCRSAIACRRQV